MLAALLLPIAFALPQRTRPWPPPGAPGQWETDVHTALRRARREKKPVVVYIATESCPHCKVMARDVWPKPAALRACEKAVCLAIYRYGRDPNDPRAHPPSEWAIRFNVMAYPQFRFLDGWGRPLPVSTQVVRTPRGLAAAIDRAVAALPKKLRRPDSLAEAAGGRLGVASLDAARCRKLFDATEDPVQQLALLGRVATLPRGDDTTAVLGRAVAGPNDYVRQRALGLLASKAEPEHAARMAAGVIERVLSGKSGFPNPNNMLIGAVAAAKGIADPALVDPLHRVIEKSTGNNYATLASVEALLAIADRHPDADVGAALQAALRIEGAYASRIRKLVEGR